MAEASVGTGCPKTLPPGRPVCRGWCPRDGVTQFLTFFRAVAGGSLERSPTDGSSHDRVVDGRRECREPLVRGPQHDEARLSVAGRCAPTDCGPATYFRTRAAGRTGPALTVERRVVGTPRRPARKGAIDGPSSLAMGTRVVPVGDPVRAEAEALRPTAAVPEQALVLVGAWSRWSSRVAQCSSRPMRKGFLSPSGAPVEAPPNGHAAPVAATPWLAVRLGNARGCGAPPAAGGRGSA